MRIETDELSHFDELLLHLRLFLSALSKSRELVEPGGNPLRSFDQVVVDDFIIDHVVQDLELFCLLNCFCLVVVGDLYLHHIKRLAD